MANYTPSAEFAQAASSAKGKAKGKGKAEKDPNAPKGARSSYMFFMKDMRAKVKAENPGVAFGELVRIVLLGRWILLSLWYADPWHCSRGLEQITRYQIQ